MAEKRKSFIEEAKESLGRLPLQNVPVSEDLKHIEAEGGSIDLEIYACEKIEKVVLSTIKIHKAEVSDETVIVWPDNTHNLPALWCTLSLIPSVMNVAIFDFVPLMDCVVWPGYAEKYIQGVSDLKIKAFEIFADTIIDKALDLPSLSIYAFSPYKVVVKISDEGIGLMPQAIHEYSNAFITLWDHAEHISHETERDFYLRKKSATRNLMKGNDPGYPIMCSVFGKEKTRRVFDLVF